MPFQDVNLPETTAERDERKVKQWQKMPNGPMKDRLLSEILSDMGGIIGQVVNQYRAAPVPTQILELQARRLAVEALQDYRPGMTKPSTFVSTRLRQRLFRYVSEHQNVARIPEETVRKIGPFNRAVNDLTSRFGREPSTTELADHMSLPVAHISRLRKMLEKTNISMSEFEPMEDFHHDPDMERARLGYYSLTEQEKIVFDYLLGDHGKPQLKPSQIAREMKISPARVSALKKSVAKKLAPYLRG